MAHSRRHFRERKECDCIVLFAVLQPPFRDCAMRTFIYTFERINKKTHTILLCQGFFRWRNNRFFFLQIFYGFFCFFEEKRPFPSRKLFTVSRRPCRSVNGSVTWKCCCLLFVDCFRCYFGFVFVLVLWTHATIVFAFSLTCEMTLKY